MAFKRRMKVLGTLLLTLSAVTPAASVYVIAPGVIQTAGSGAFLSLAVAAVVGLAMAFVYAELGSAHPIAGGEYALIGRTLGPLTGFAYMGANTVGGVLPVATLSLGASDYLHAVWPAAQPLPIALAIVVFATLMGVLNIRTNAVVTGVFLAVEIGVLIVLASLGLLHPARSLAEVALHPMALTPAGLGPATISAIGLATTVSVFAYNGFGAAVYFSEEVVGAPRRVATTILWALALTVAFEFIPITGVLMGAPDLKALILSPSPFSDFVSTRGGRALSVAVSLGVALAIVNAVIAIGLVNARFFFSSGRDRAWAGPVNAALTRIHPRFQSPWVATLLAGALALATCFIPFHVLLVLNGTWVVAIYTLLCLGAIAGRISGATAHGAYRMPLYPVAPVLGLVTLGYVVYANWIDPEIGRPSLIATVAMLAISAVYCLIMRRRRGPGWVVVGPTAEEPAE
jgi:amino acid transporter